MLIRCLYNGMTLIKNLCGNIYCQLLNPAVVSIIWLGVNVSVMQEEAMTVLFIHESFFVYMLFDMSFISTSA